MTQDRPASFSITVTSLPPGQQLHLTAQVTTDAEKKATLSASAEQVAKPSTIRADSQDEDAFFESQRASRASPPAKRGPWICPDCLVRHGMLGSADEDSDAPSA
ncbi:hypothetical protein CF319_g3141 [Tilletia indica]|uniref:Uncharacterized protein n=1 Tax=Tilletia indica TaxID=43049 RepID=A0A177TKT8_9BASI|nr:hypothetical protein CF319_g3141 [Tilletia indica]KAE8229213.1 hypothetical protein CF326_g5824 [Tilletia indica]KAE8260413.1 hypothetical protein A4X13_0g352 [Tilletia indica]